MPAQRCSQCNINWPGRSQFSKCPACGEPTWFGFNIDPMAEDQTTERIAEEEVRRARIKAAAENYAEFEKYYEEREARRFREELSQAW